ncbi:MAG TPA: EamA/RhaT family transporter [Proteiniclasticum sp.]|uniref:DMT family transporter n=1 Tax=Proteiniclasticum sp. TaxID=2053595 RepID=UPI000E84992B|nr:DMT family transporter [Proteiniclasticum sp.]HBW14532.1 EamA/RhaT family transporter [Proteiniclasticum sp.]
MERKHNLAILWAILAAALYAISSPISKILLDEIPPTMMAALLYLGAGIGMSIISLYRLKTGKMSQEMKLTKKEFPYIISMITLDIIAPIFLMVGLTMTTPATVSLLNNFEIVATSLIALFIFKEYINKRLWIAISLITISSILLSVENFSNLSFSFGSLLVLLASISWGFENNMTRMLSTKDPMQVVIIKGFGSGFGSLVISLVINETTNNVLYIFMTLVLGFIAYGLSIYLYVYAQRYLGAAKTSAYYAVAPFIGASLSLIIFLELPSFTFIIAMVIMIIGTYFASAESK